MLSLTEYSVYKQSQPCSGSSFPVRCEAAPVHLNNPSLYLRVPGRKPCVRVVTVLERTVQPTQLPWHGPRQHYSRDKFPSWNRDIVYSMSVHHSRRRK